MKTIQTASALVFAFAVLAPGGAHAAGSASVKVQNRCDQAQTYTIQSADSPCAGPRLIFS